MSDNKKEKKSNNSNLHKAREVKNDEFYTQLVDIEKEVKHYKKYFKDKVVYCNCDDPEWSNFFKYFTNAFDFLGLKKLITTHYEKNNGTSYKLELSKYEEVIKTDLNGDGDFRSEECIEILKEADVVITNPPFSLFREYVAQLVNYDKNFLIIGSMNGTTYKEIFKLIKENKIWLGVNNVNKFIQPDGTIKKFGNICWYSNLEHKKRNEELLLFKTYKGNEKDYPKYDNYDIININKIKEIPKDYKAPMGVPITIIDKYNPEQFEILDCNNYRSTKNIPLKKHGLIKDKESSINGKPIYVRIVIRNKNPKK
jgi:hypothetical protein